MRTSLTLMMASVALGLWACHPSERCGGELVFYGGTCRPCPTGSTFQDGACVCDEPQYYELRNFKCELISDASLPPEEDAGEMPAGGGCGDYCDFIGTCVGENSLASFLGAVVTGLHADDAAACTTACEGDVGGTGETDEAVMCLVAGAGPSMCESLEGMDQLGAAFTVVGDCCGTRKDNPLCQSICATLKADALVSSMIDFCD